MRFVIVLLSSAALLAAAPQAKKTSAPSSGSSSKAPAVPGNTRLTLPPDATPMPDGRYSYTDKDGKKWIYVRTPMGITRFDAAQDRAHDAQPAAPAASPFGKPSDKPADPFANVKITESGDIVTFERPSPFGVSKWQKKRSELTETESAAVQRAHDKNSAK